MASTAQQKDTRHVNVKLMLSGLLLFAWPMVVAAQRRDLPAFCVATAVAFATWFMHMTETKHGLRALEMPAHSSLFLWADRVVSVYAAGWGIVRLATTGRAAVLTHTFNQAVLGFGLLCSAVGEQTANLRVYVVAHTLWHAAAAYALTQTVACYD